MKKIKIEICADDIESARRLLINLCDRLTFPVPDEMNIGREDGSAKMLIKDIKLVAIIRHRSPPDIDLVIQKHIGDEWIDLICVGSCSSMETATHHRDVLNVAIERGEDFTTMSIQQIQEYLAKATI